MRTWARGNLCKVRKIAIIKNTPTPIAIVSISTIFGILGTWSASTCKSGSEIVTAVPIMILTRHIRLIFPDFTSRIPVSSPIGIIAISLPSEKNPIPIVSITAPNRNSMIISNGIGAIVILSTMTIAVIGRTDETASIIFSFNFLLIVISPFLIFIIIYFQGEGQ